MLKLTNIDFQYPNSAFGVSIESLTFEDKKICVILGENGSGKTTLLNIIGGHLKTTTGNIELFEKEISHLKAEQRPTATVFQQIGLFPHLTIQQNIEIAIEPNRLFGRSDETVKKAQDILKDFNLSQFAKRKPNELSIGQQQRVAIARALSSSPQILLLDEPTSALDFVNINILKKLLIEIKEKGIVPVIIIISHDLPFVMSIADEIKFIKNGKVVFVGSSDSFKVSKYYIN